MKKVIIIGSGVAGTEAGTFLGHNAKIPLEVIEIECEPERKFGGWGFQKFPNTETTNLALRKMYLGDDPQDIMEWTATQDYDFHPDRPFPRALMQEYVKWRRDRVKNDLVKYTTITGEAMRASLAPHKGKVFVELDNGVRIEGDKLVMASGSISVKIPEYLNQLLDHPRVIIDPLTKEGHERRSQIPQNAKILVLGTGLTGEEQVNVLVKSNHTNITLFSRGGKRHFNYQLDQTNLPLLLDSPPEFITAETPEEFNTQLNEFFGHHLNLGHSPEDIFAAIRPFWTQLRAELGGCVKAADRLRSFKRELAVNSIGVSWEVSENLKNAESEGKMSVIHGNVLSINSELEVEFDTKIEKYDYIINAVGRNIIKHSIWDQLLNDGIAKKHAGIGVRVSETGRMVNSHENEDNLIWVVGMARAGDHALRHGYLGNTAFNVPQVRSHLNPTMKDLLSTLQ